MTSAVNPVAFIVLAACSLGGALMVMLSKNVVHAAFWMLEALVATAGIYLLLQAEFLALVQIMVYAGAVSVLVLFVIMLTLRSREDAERPRDISPLGAALTLIFGGILVWAMSQYTPPSTPMPASAPNIAALGHELFTRWVLPFEIAAGVLLVALVGAVWWAGRGDEL